MLLLGTVWNPFSFKINCIKGVFCLLTCPATDSALKNQENIVQCLTHWPTLSTVYPVLVPGLSPTAAALPLPTALGGRRELFCLRGGGKQKIGERQEPKLQGWPNTVKNTVQMTLKHREAWSINHFSREPVPASDHHLS